AFGLGTSVPSVLLPRFAGHSAEAQGRQLPLSSALRTPRGRRGARVTCCRRAKSFQRSRSGQATRRRKGVTEHTTGTRDEWLAVRLELLAAEKELTRRSDELARRRQQLPWVR